MSNYAPELGGFELNLWDGQFNHLGQVSGVQRVEAAEAHNRVVQTKLTVGTNHVMLAALARDDTDTRLTVDHLGRQVFSGWVEDWAGAYNQGRPTVTITYLSDKVLLDDMYGYPVPGSPTDSQFGAVEDKRTGAAETVVKALIGANKGRWGAYGSRITVAPNKGRGGQITTAFRMTPLGDQLWEMLDAAGIGLSVTQVDGGLLVDVYEPRTVPVPLTVESGAVLDWGWSRATATATRAIVGGPNEGTSREFRLQVNAAREARGRVREMLVDAGGLQVSSEIDAEGAKGLAEAGPKSGLSVTLQATGAFSYGRVRTGDQVTVEFAPGLALRSQLLREAVLVWSTETGPNVRATPTIGERTDDPDTVLNDTLRRLARTDRTRQAR